MTNVSIEDINNLVGLQLGVRLVAEDSRLVEDLGAESADVANLVAAVEEKYHVIVKESEIAKIFTPADLFDLVQRKLGDSHF
ncbi:MAG TPA: phosphopantetheine-binding protein [Anaerolineales bacterium]|nr:phosphopantetheine-binding protein [Anaerolineales bacterium]